jgi:trans-2,3-dihydro-3-hydroxyanthranilate isomerase
MRTYQYRLLNVFAESTFGGNPLCVFADASGLSDIEMQAIALQFNLSETTFLLPSTTATAHVRIFTPTFEMAFAGHPTLGSAHVVRDTLKAGDAITLEMKAGVIPVRAEGNNWTLTANQPTSREAVISRAALAQLLRINEADVLEGARWINTGSEQLIVPLANADAVMRVAPEIARLSTMVSNANRSMVYVFAPDEERGENNLRARFFFTKHDSVIEDPATGSATANLGGWMLHHGRAPCRFQIAQGEAISRTSHLKLEVTNAGAICVGGRVMDIGQGSITI